MSAVKLLKNASGTGILSIAAPNTNTDRTLTLPDATTTLVGTDTTQTLTNKTLTSPTIGGTPTMNASVITSGTAQASTSGAYIDFTGIPSWVKRITVMFNGVSTNGTSDLLVQLGTSGGITSSGYRSSASQGTSSASSTAGFILTASLASADTSDGIVTISLLGSNAWSASSALANGASNTVRIGAGGVTLGGTLTQLRITTAGGVNTFDAGTINIQYE